MSKKSRPDLKSKTDLIIHTFDSFLTAQTRLFTFATSRGISRIYDISRKQEFLCLDDLMIFSISIRKLLEYTGLISFANRHKTPLCHPVFDDRSCRIKEQKLSVGFETLVNQFIHAVQIEIYTNKKHLFRTLKRLDLSEYTAEDLKESPRDIIYPVVYLKADKIDEFVKLRDVIAQSEIIIEKIIEVCADSYIFLELTDRGID